MLIFLDYICNVYCIAIQCYFSIIITYYYFELVLFLYFQGFFFFKFPFVLVILLSDSASHVTDQSHNGFS